MVHLKKGRRIVNDYPRRSSYVETSLDSLQVGYDGLRKLLLLFLISFLLTVKICLET